MKCPVSGTKLHVRGQTGTSFYYVASGTYCGGQSSNIKVNALLCLKITPNPTLNLPDSVNESK